MVSDLDRKLIMAPDLKFKPVIAADLKLELIVAIGQPQPSAIASGRLQKRVRRARHGSSYSSCCPRGISLMRRKLPTGGLSQLLAYLPFPTRAWRAKREHTTGGCQCAAHPHAHTQITSHLRQLEGTHLPWHAFMPTPASPHDSESASDGALEPEGSSFLRSLETLEPEGSSFF